MKAPLLACILFACTPEAEPSGDPKTSTETSEQSDTPPTSGTTPTTTPIPCEPLPGVPGEDVRMSTTFDGIQRSWILHLPTDYDCEPLPVLLGIHGYYGSGDGFQNDTAKLFRHLNDHNYIGIFPDGLPAGTNGYPALVTSFNDLTSRFDDGPDGPTCTDAAWDYLAYDNCGADEEARDCRWGTSCADDAGFFRALIDEVSASWTVDADRIYMTGFSQGGQTVQGLACEMSDILAAVSPQHGFAANGHTCGPTSKLSLFQVWGRSDNVVNGNEQPSSDGMIYDGADETALEWANAQGCSLTPTPYTTISDGMGGWSCTEHADCTTGAEVVTCSWAGAHYWGRNDTDGNFSLEATWTFLEAQSR